MDNSSRSVASLIPYLKQRYEPANQWQDDDILKYLAWGAVNKFLFIARNDDDSVVGVALARPVASFPSDLFEFDVNGKNVHINFLIADSASALLLLGFTILDTFSDCDTVTFNRLKKGATKQKSYPAKRVRHTLFNIRNYHG